MEIITRKDAQEKQLKRYFLGTPCKQGHVVEKLTSTRECVECKRIREQKVDYRKSYMKTRYANKASEFIAKQTEYTKQNYEQVTAYQQTWRNNNSKRIAQYRKDNAGLYAYHAALRRKAVKRATPKWCEFEKIKQLYINAKEISVLTGIEQDIDHIIPLKSKFVCGLHCLDNLRIIPSLENGKKKNKF